MARAKTPKPVPDAPSSDPAVATPVSSNPVSDPPEDEAAEEAYKRPTALNNKDLLLKAREDARRSVEYWGNLYRDIESDVNFLGGLQWEAEDKAQREAEGRVTLTINDLPQYLDQVVSDFRQNPTSIQVIASDIAATDNQFISMSGRKYSGSEVREALIRQIEYKCGAQMHYNLAGQHAAEGGLGFLRVYSDYCDPKSFNQDLRVERIKNRWNVFLDPMATEPDWSDGNLAFVSEWMPKKEFEKRYPDASPTPIASDKDFWFKEGFVRVTEYYWREEYDCELLLLSNGTIVSDEDEEAFEVAKVSGRVVMKRTVQKNKVCWAKLTYNDVLEDPIALPGETIPVVPVIGKRIEGKEDEMFYGLFRFAKDPKMLENYFLSSVAERISLAPKAPYIVAVQQIEGYENEWAEANNGMKPFLRFNAVPGLQAPQRATPPIFPQGEVQTAMLFRDKVKAAVGMYDANVGKEQQADQSGRAIMALQKQGDTGNFVFSDNLGIAVSRVGRIFLDWLGVIYDTERFITIRHENDEVDTIEINKVVPATKMVPDVGEMLVNDIRAGNFDQHVVTGPAFSTLREQTTEQFVDVLKAVPQVGEYGMDVFWENSDMPGADRLAKRARKAIPPQLLDQEDLADPDEKGPPPPPTPEQEIAALALKTAQSKDEAAAWTAEGAIATAKAAIIKAGQTPTEPGQAPVVVRPNGGATADQGGGQQMNGAPAPVPAPIAPPAPAQPQQQAPAITPQDIIELVKNTLAQAIPEIVSIVSQSIGQAGGGQPAGAVDTAPKTPAAPPAVIPTPPPTTVRG